MCRPSPEAYVSVSELPPLLIELFERAAQPLLPGAQGPVKLLVRYLRRKPGRGLVVIYSVDEDHSTTKTHTQGAQRWVSVTLTEHMLEGARIHFTATAAQQAPFEIRSSGLLQVHDLGLSIQVFPADAGLPALAVCCETPPSRPLFEAIQAAVQLQLQTAPWQLTSVDAESVRYKPANWCVIRYHLTLQAVQERQGMLLQQHHLPLFGKVYAQPEQAQRIQSLQQALYQEQEHTGQLPFLPRPLGIVESLGLILTQAVESIQADIPADDLQWACLRPGSEALHPRVERGRGGTMTNVRIPEEELCLTAHVLARLHTSQVRPALLARRMAGQEAQRVRERAGLLAGRHPALAEHLQGLANQLAFHLERSQPEDYRLAHGSFKPSQLLFRAHRVFVVDFDGCCLADPALDVGYFLAYLRPSGLLYQRPGMRAWFEAAAERFRRAYADGLYEQEMDQAAIHGILERSRLFEAALLLKIATRRVSRLHSPRSQELAALLDEMSICLAGASKRG